MPDTRTIRSDDPRFAEHFAKGGVFEIRDYTSETEVILHDSLETRWRSAVAQRIAHCYFALSPCMITFKYASDQSLMVYLGEEINIETHHRVLKLLRLLEAEPIPHVSNLHPAYCSILIVFDPVRQDHATIEAILQQYVQASIR